MPDLEVYRIGYTIKGQSPTETELDATDLCQLFELFHTFLNENPGEKLERVNSISCFRLPGKFPDSITQEQMHEYGYNWNGMIPLGAAAAEQRWNSNHPVYALFEDDTETLMESIEQIREHAAIGGMFGYEAEETTVAYQFW